MRTGTQLPTSMFLWLELSHNVLCCVLLIRATYPTALKPRDPLLFVSSVLSLISLQSPTLIQCGMTCRPRYYTVLLHSTSGGLRSRQPSSPFRLLGICFTRCFVFSNYSRDSNKILPLREDISSLGNFVLSLLNMYARKQPATQKHV